MLIDRKSMPRVKSLKKLTPNVGRVGGIRKSSPPEVFEDLVNL